MTPTVRALPAVALAMILGAGCGGQAPTGGTLPPAATSAPSPASTIDPTPVPTGPARSSEPSSSPSSLPSSPTDIPGAVEDPALISILPADIGGNPVTLESQAFAEALADEGFATNIEAAAFGVVVAGDDLASAVVARPVDGVFSGAWYRDWRDSYNDGACAQAGGVARNAEAEIGGRTVYIGTCSGGLRTYHTWIEDRGLLVSAFSIGEGRFGEQLMAGLRP